MASLVLVDFENGADVGVIDERNRFRLASQPACGIRIARQLARQELQRHAAGQPRVLGVVDDAHAADAELADNPVVRNGVTEHH